jgi:hypothetical protein
MLANIMRLVQLARKDGTRKVAVVDGEKLRALDRFDSIYRLAMSAISAPCGLASFVSSEPAGRELDYEEIYCGRSAWRLLPPIDHPETNAKCLVSGTGLTHTASAEKRRAMHSSMVQPENPPENDSIRIYKWGLEGGRPDPGAVGVAPEWFYKGTGAILRACGQPLTAPAFAEDAGEEPEIAGVYLVDPGGQPRRVGLAIGNEFADHQFEKRNYLYLAASKLRECALGPELWIDPRFEDVRGRVAIERDGATIWSAQLATGEKNMCHSLQNIEHHHFKFPEHRQPGDVHVHFFGADAFSFGEGIIIRDKDIVEISFDSFGRALRNPIRFQPGEKCLITASPV